MQDAPKPCESAVAILRRASHALYPDPELRSTPGYRLMDELEVTLKAAHAGFSGPTNTDRNDYLISFRGRYAILRYHPETMAFEVASAPNQNAGEFRAAPIHYDAGISAFVGDHVDADITPTPGQQLPRCKPLAVLAGMISDALQAR